MEEAARKKKEKEEEEERKKLEGTKVEFYWIDCFRDQPLIDRLLL